MGAKHKTALPAEARTGEIRVPYKPHPAERDSSTWDAIDVARLKDEYKELSEKEIELEKELLRVTERKAFLEQSIKAKK